MTLIFGKTRRNSEWDFLDDPVARFDADGQNKLSIISKWLEPFSTERWQGNSSSMWMKKQILLVLQEDMTPECAEKKLGCSGNNHIGTFIVNGGRCSPVISFSPKINFVACFFRKNLRRWHDLVMDAGSVTKEEGEDVPKTV